MSEEEFIKHGGYHPDYSKEVEYFQKEKIYSIQIEANIACDQGCMYCYASSDHSKIKELPKIEIIKILDTAANMKVQAIDWLGGDPLLREDWEDLLQYANKKGLKNNVWTSGIPLKNIDISKRLVEFDRYLWK